MTSPTIDISWDESTQTQLGVPSQKSSEIGSGLILIALLIHVLLGIASRPYPQLVYLQQIGCVMVGTIGLINKRIEWVACSGFYVMGSEVLWRMSRATVFHEGSKYFCTVLFLGWLIRTRRYRPPLSAILYFVPLLPSIALLQQIPTFDDFRRVLSASISGPISLFASLWFFSDLVISRGDLYKLMLCIITASASISATVISSILSLERITYTTSSNFETSGGFGPNQVAGILALGALACYVVVVYCRPRNYLLYMTLLLLFAGQSALTFSRAGIVILIASIALSVLVLTGAGFAQSLRMSVLLFVLGICANSIVIPWLDDFTNGSISQRFQRTDVTERDAIALADLKIWEEHLILGVGPGMGNSLRGMLVSSDRGGLYEPVAAHTEFTRMLSEHGMLGLIALAGLLMHILASLARDRCTVSKSLVVCFLSFALLYMLVNAMRLLIPSLILGFIAARFELDRATD